MFTSDPSPASRREATRQATHALIDFGFLPVRAQLLEVSAFLDRVERHGIAEDFRCKALLDAAQVLVDGKSERTRRVLEALSDPTLEPDAVSTGKAALGAWPCSD